MKASPILVRTVALLKEREVMFRDTLISELWPLVQPGVAYRLREKEIERLRRRHRTSLNRKEMPVALSVEYGAKVRVREGLSQWKRLGILSEEEIDGRRAYRLERVPKYMKVEAK